jgi:hypothetical protein
MFRNNPDLDERNSLLADLVYPRPVWLLEATVA